MHRAHKKQTNAAKKITAGTAHNKSTGMNTLLTACQTTLPQVAWNISQLWHVRTHTGVSNGIYFAHLLRWRRDYFRHTRSWLRRRADAGKHCAQGSFEPSGADEFEFNESGSGHFADYRIG